MDNPNIPETMRVIAKTGPARGASVIELPVPVPEKDELLVRINACAICGTDIHDYTWNEQGKAFFAQGGNHYPRIMGHEFAGQVIALGEEVTGFSIGDRITAETHLPCGKCYQCRNGNSYNCENLRGFKAGVFSEYAVISEKLAVHVPDSFSDDEASTLEPFGVAVHAMKNVDVTGDTALVLGGGPIGIYLVMLLKAMGASLIAVSEISEYRRDMALKAGADIVIDPRDEDVASIVRKLTGGLGAGTVFDASGNVNAIRSGFDALRKCGTVVMVSLPSEPLILDVAKDIVLKAASIYGVYGREIMTSWDKAIGLISSGAVDIRPVITHNLSLFEEYDKGFKLASGGQSGKVVFHIK